MPETKPVTKSPKKTLTMHKPSAQAIINKAATAAGDSLRKKGLSIYPGDEVMERITRARTARPGVLPISANQWVVDAILDKLEKEGV